MMNHVLITGASGGIGLALAEAFARAGYGVALHYHRHAQPAVEAALRLQDAYEVPTVALAADLTDSAAVTRLVDTAQRELGFLDTLVNNAGIAQHKLFTELTDEDWETMLSVHLGGAFRCCRAVLPEMIRRHRGTILNVSSMWGQIGGACEVHYSAAKAGLIGLTRALAKEVGPSGITVNCIAPGVIRTPMLDSLSPETLGELAEETPLRRLGTPEDVAAAAVFLASPAASFITGQVLGVGGGIVI